MTLITSFCTQPKQHKGRQKSAARRSAGAERAALCTAAPLCSLPGQRHLTVLPQPAQNRAEERLPCPARPPLAAAPLTCRCPRALRAGRARRPPAPRLIAPGTKGRRNRAAPGALGKSGG